MKKATPKGMMKETDNENLVRMRACYDELFPSGEPSFRTFCEWKAQRYFPSVKIGRTVLLNPVAVRAALEDNFTVPAKTKDV